MIASPCKKCNKKYDSKEKCILTCKELQHLQALQATIGERFVGNAIDYTADDRYHVVMPV